ncbi:hypothetical protein ASPWEDRAFT_44562 [Aspergillus wentii DTO 134E9]|uniref:F-box domain-containing protein n=1 Tax=Aspergillus wentii DTO 134E9 TaxID=1073089 RepID=A0A1L9RC03_ASPWE|nr:uncharacterized protein ASPWEDRAFT_44562 [Aspergillus wentii DTO 134E9]OJJ32442.1 hypothetical protein ASPWEDRAFT_44562 [Aspergillus wentii DTO 134E9]
MAQRNLKGILGILRQKHDEWKYGTDRSEATEYLMEAADIGSFQPIQSLINRARRRTSKRSKSRGRLDCKSRFYYILTEILHMILDNLPIADVVAVQRALTSYFGDSYWRSRTSIGIYHEVRNVINETLDWEFLCLELENLSKTWDGEEGLVCRRYLLKRLDEIQAAPTLL